MAMYFIRKLYIEGLCRGNFTKKEASDICDMIRTTFRGKPLHVESRHDERVVCIPPNANSVMDFNASKEDDKISVAELYYQLEQDWELVSTKWMALFDLFSDIIKESYFDQLRTTEQLGYDVECRPLILHGVFGFFFEIQSFKKDPERLLESINKFIKGLEVLFESLDDKKFNNHKNSLVVKLMDKASSLKGESDRLWTTITDQRAKFDIGTKKAEKLKKIKKKDMIKWCGKYFDELSPKCRRLNVRFWGADTRMKADDSESEFDRIEKFKREKGFWGAPQA